MNNRLALDCTLHVWYETMPLENWAQRTELRILEVMAEIKIAHWSHPAAYSSTENILTKG